MKRTVEIYQKLDHILNFVDQNDGFLLTTHMNSDGDAIGAVTAFAHFLKKKNKYVRIILDDQQIDSKYQYLLNGFEVEAFNEVMVKQPDEKLKSFILFDAPGDKRIGAVAGLINNQMSGFKIDHHPSETEYSVLDWVDTEASSASAMVYEVLNRSNVEIDLTMAKALYSGIVFDTGRLSFSNTTFREMEICAHLLKIGVEPGEITNALFNNSSFDALRIIGKGLSGLKQFKDGKISVISLFKEDMDLVESGEVEVLASQTLSIDSAEVGVFIRQREEDFFKISLRSKNKVDVSIVARKFNGGGHKKAAGCSFTGQYTPLLKKMISELEKVL